MKNRLKIILALLSLFSSMLSANLLQPGVPASEDMPLRINLGGRIGFHKSPIPGLEGYGVGNLGGGLSFIHNVGYDLEYGLAGLFEANSIGKLFNKTSTDNHLNMNGLHFEFTLRYMPEVAESLHFGASLGVGYIYTIIDSAEPDLKGIRDLTSFGDLEFRVGPALSYMGFYIMPNLTLKNVRIYKEAPNAQAKDRLNKLANHFGVEMPTGIMFDVADGASLYVEANPMFSNFKADKLGDTFKIEATLGFSVSL